MVKVLDSENARAPTPPPTWQSSSIVNHETIFVDIPISNNEDGSVMNESATDYIEKIESLLPQVNQKYRKLDLFLGVRKKFNQFKIGNKNVGFTKNSIDIEGEKYLLTDGLIELIFFKNVNNDSISPNDVRDYKNIINNTNALRKKYEPDRSFKKINNNKKFDTYLSNFYEGSGLPKFMIAQNTSSN